jgi:hypothetical protein
VSVLAVRIVALLAAVCSLGWTQASRAQTKPHTVIVQVTDSASKPISGSSLTVMRGVSTVIAQATTDAAGRHIFAVAGKDENLEVVARKIGFVRGDRFFALDRDTIAISIVLQRAVQSLETVRVTAEEAAKHKSYFVDADAIATSDRPLLDGLDVFTKMRPDMLYSRSAGAFENCDIEEVWINGRRVPISPYDSLDPMIASRRAGIAKPAKSRPVSLAVLKTLSLVKPEHISEISYRDCMDASIGKIGDRNAAFITLKAGVAFDLSRGTYVIAQRPAVGAYRTRLLGLYDEKNGEPIGGATVTNVATGEHVETTTTGTVSLAFLPTGKSKIKISKPGYADMSIDISISQKDTIPLTIVLSRTK